MMESLKQKENIIQNQEIESKGRFQQTNMNNQKYPSYYSTTNSMNPTENNMPTQNQMPYLTNLQNQNQIKNSLLPPQNQILFNPLPNQNNMTLNPSNQNNMPLPPIPNLYSQNSNNNPIATEMTNNILSYFGLQR